MPSTLFRLVLLLLAGGLCGAAFALVEEGGERLYLVAAVVAALAIIAYVMFHRPKDEDRRAGLDLMLGDMEDPRQRGIMLRSGLWMVLHLVGLAALAAENPVEEPLAYAAFAAFAGGGLLLGVETWRFATYDEYLKSYYLRALAMTGLWFAFFVIVLQGAEELLTVPPAGLFTYYLGFSVILMGCCFLGKSRKGKAERA